MGLKLKPTLLPIALLCAITGTIRSVEMIDLAFDKSQDGPIQDQGWAQVPFQFVNEGSAIEDIIRDTGDGIYGLYCDGIGGVLKAPTHNYIPFGKLSQFEIAFTVFPESTGSPAAPETLFMAGEYPGPGSILGISFCGEDAVQILRYADGGWRNDRIALSEAIRLHDWQTLRFRFETDPGHGMRIKVFLDDKPIGELESLHGIGSPTTTTQLVIGGMGGNTGNFRGLFRRFRFADGEIIPDQSKNPASLEPMTHTPDKSGQGDPAANGWSDTFYQYRIPITVETDRPGWHRIPIDPREIVAAINSSEEMAYNPQWFAYNQVKLEVGEPDGQTTVPLEGGFFLLAEQKNLAEDLLETRPEVDGRGMARVTLDAGIEAGGLYLLEYVASNAGSSPMRSYDPIFPEGNPMRHQNYLSSYEAPLLPKARTRHQRLFIPDENPLDLHVGGVMATEIESLSVRSANIVLLADLPEGASRINLYYQPTTGHHLSLPERQLDANEASDREAKLVSLGVAEKFVGRTRYRLANTPSADIWFAESTVKMTPGTKPPTESESAVEISLARGEAQTFQIVITPRERAHLSDVSISAPSNATGQLPQPEIAQLDYVTIHRPSYITPVEYTGKIGDPLISFQPSPLDPETGNLVICATIEADRTAKEGIYEAEIRLDFSDGPVRVPLIVNVRPFTLPAESPLRSNVGAQYLAKVGQPGENPPMGLDYHGLSRSTKESGPALKRLARDYFEVMARNRFDPKTPALYSEIGLEWTPPPLGYNVDGEDNFFKLHGWDFTEFNETLSHFVDGMGVNQFLLMHLNPTTANIFMHLPGDPVETFPQSPPFVTMAWQTFRDMTMVAYGKREGDPYYDTTIEISRDQFDRLLLDFFRPIAQNLEEHGWLDKAWILIDERTDPERLRHFLSIMKSDPLVARIKIGICMQSFEAFNHRTEDGTDYVFRDLLDIYIPQMDENYNRWEPYMFADYDIEEEPEKLWNYAVYGSRLCIDTPGINNRILGLDLFNRGASGYLVWEVFGWYEWYDADPNPWKDPYCRMGNGVLSYFYPPRRDGSKPDEPDFTITPSIRVLTHRLAVQDYEYAWLLRNLIESARGKGADVSEAEATLEEISRFFENSNHWSQNDAWFLTLRERMAEAITGLQTVIQ